MIGSVTFDIYIYESTSLKQKRAVLQRVLTRIKQRFNVSVAETSHQNLWQRSELTIVGVNSDRVACEKELQRVLTFIDSFPEVERTETVWEWL
ncbi:DUF503 family protein [Texcoconibacillus texcoconensis]|uniref:DUF503 domain-containing protein n=1 Tax=Texcoconibacillus texcoconensis TaxID=1095777 RepID=A0A840QKS3_9BACI|nr:hypothetical protein [Texcoconibacillus texcoconensis]